MSSREGKLVIFLLIIVALYLSYTYLINPQMQDIDTMKAEIVLKENMVTDMELAEAMIPKMESENAELRGQLNELLSAYLGKVEQEDVILLINEILLRSDVLVDQLSFSDFSSRDSGAINSEIMTVELPLDGTYKDVLSLLSSFWRFDQNIFVESLNLSGENVTEEAIDGARDSIVSGSTSIVFMRVNDENAANDPIFEWFLDEGYDIENPFLIQDKNTFFNSNYYYIGKDVEFYNEKYIPFVDIKNHWIEPIANIFGENGYISGDENNRFYPDNNMSRMEFVILVDKLYRWPIVDNPVELTTFNDSNLIMAMDPNEYKILQKAVNSGYVIGFSDNTLRPYDKISYAELEYFSKRVPNGESFNWQDFADILENEVGITSRGRDNIDAYATKAEIVYMLYYLNR